MIFFNSFLICHLYNYKFIVSVPKLGLPDHINNVLYNRFFIIIHYIFNWYYKKKLDFNNSKTTILTMFEYEEVKAVSSE